MPSIAWVRMRSKTRRRSRLSGATSSNRKLLKSLRKLSKSGRFGKASPELQKKLQQLMKDNHLSLPKDAKEREKMLSDLKKFLKDESKKLAKARHKEGDPEDDQEGDDSDSDNEDRDGKAGRGGATARRRGRQADVGRRRRTQRRQVQRDFAAARHAGSARQGNHFAKCVRPGGRARILGPAHRRSSRGARERSANLESHAESAAPCRSPPLLRHTQHGRQRPLRTPWQAWPISLWCAPRPADSGVNRRDKGGCTRRARLGLPRCLTRDRPGTRKSVRQNKDSVTNLSQLLDDTRPAGPTTAATALRLLSPAEVQEAQLKSSACSTVWGLRSSANVTCWSWW